MIQVYLYSKDNVQDGTDVQLLLPLLLLLLSLSRHATNFSAQRHPAHLVLLCQYSRILFDLPVSLFSLFSLPLCLSASLSLISLSGPFLLLHLSFVACTFSGECLDHMEDENMKLLTFPVKVEDGSVFLDLPPTSELDQVHNHMLRSIRIYRVHVMLCFSCFQRVSFFFFEQVYFFRFFSSSLAWYCGRGLDFRQMGY